MKNLQKVIAKIESELDEKDQVREVALKSTVFRVRFVPVENRIPLETVVQVVPSGLTANS